MKATRRALGFWIVGALLLGSTLGLEKGVVAAQALVDDQSVVTEEVPVADPNSDSVTETPPEVLPVDPPIPGDPIEPTEPPIEEPVEEPEPPTTEPPTTEPPALEPPVIEPEVPVEVEPPVEPETPPVQPPAVVNISASVPTLSGTAQSGKVITASPGKWSPSSVSLKYQWLLDGKSISKATSTKYTIKTTDRGKKLSVKVTGSLAGSTAKSASSKTVTVLKVLGSKQSTIGGTSVWHKYVNVKPSGWTSGTTFTYQWYRNGKAITGARSLKSSLQIWNADWCQTLTVKVTGKKTGYESKSVTSKPLKNAGCPKTGNHHKMYAGQRMEIDQQIASKNWKHGFRMSANGNGYLNNHGRARWAAVGAKGGKLHLTPSGDLQIRKGNTIKWSSKTKGKNVKYAAINASGELGLYTSSGKRVWTASGNNGYRWNNWGTPNISQNDGRWAGSTVGVYRFGAVACVPTSFAMAAQSYGVNVNPHEVGVVMHNYGDFNHGIAGAGGQSIKAAAAHYGLAATPLSSQSAIRKALKNNQPVIALVSGPSSVTSPGSTHAVVMTGLYGGGGQTTVRNPWGGWSTTYSVSTMWAYQSWDRLDRNAGAVFWAIG